MLSVEIRKAVLEDVPQIARLWRAMTDFHIERFGYGKGIFEYKKGIEGMYRDYLKKQLRARNARVFVAEMEGKLVGYTMVMVKKLPPIYLHDKEAYIGEIFVDRRHRRKGIGSMLLAECEAWTRKKGLFSLGLIVDVKNDGALSVYKDSGFVAHHLKMSKEIQQ